jgi:uncharacterized protein
MQLDLDTSTGNFIRSFAPGRLLVNDQLITGHVIITPDEVIDGWSPARFADLTFDDFGAAMEREPEVLLFGTGQSQRFPAAALMAAIMRRGVGFEAMHTAAAARTFNVLVAERRRVVAALLVSDEADQ